MGQQPISDMSDLVMAILQVEQWSPFLPFISGCIGQLYTVSLEAESLEDLQAWKSIKPPKRSRIGKNIFAFIVTLFAARFQYCGERIDDKHHWPP